MAKKKRGQEHLDKLRERLYSRGTEPKKSKRVKLSDTKYEVGTDWPQEEDSAIRPDEVQSAPTQSADTDGKLRARTAPGTPDASGDSTMKTTTTSTRSYRMKIMLTALVFFVGAVLLSILFVLFGGNSISGENISVSMSGPFTVGGGEEIPVQVGITNNNNVAIESATLIVEYPQGTQSATDDGKVLSVERIPLDSIRSGETVNVPIRAKVFGEENEELQINASIEYRVAGSNATFFKEADPFRFKISSSPISVQIDTVRDIASGQEVEVELSITSNASTPLTNILIKAEYPTGFVFDSSDPSPISNQNVWRIEELDAESTETVTLTGVMTGRESEARTMHFSVGIASEEDQLALASVFSTASTEFIIEEPFIDVSLTGSGEQNGTISIDPSGRSNLRVDITNTLDGAIYDGVVNVALSGNALEDMDVNVTNGFYDSNTQTITWDSSSDSSLSQLAPGSSESFRFSVEPGSGVARTPQINLEASVHARRVRESDVSESLVGSARAQIKVASSITLDSQTEYDSGTFPNSGPVPPVVGETTSYTIALNAENGSNDVTDATMTATLPSYVTWQEVTTGDGSISYNQSNNSLTWDIGDIDANDEVDAAFQVSILPSASQIDTTPTLVSEQQLRAKDRFTGTTARASTPALTTQLSSSDFGVRNGRVRASDDD